MHSADPGLAATGGPRARLRPPAWAAPVGLLLSAIGLLASAYLSYEHFTRGTTLACPEGALLNCAKATTSQWSYLFGVPVAPLGVAFFAPMLLANLPGGWRSPSPWLRVGRVVALVAALGIVAWLVYAEFALVGAICLWCTVVHVVAVALFVATVAATALSGPEPDLLDEAVATSG